MLKKIFFLILFSLLIFGGFQVYFFMQKASWDGKNRFNLFFKDSPGYLVSLVPAERQIIWLPLDNQLPEVLVDASEDITNTCFHQGEQIKTCLLSQFRSRLNSWDTWRFWWYIRNLAPEKIIKVGKIADYFRDEAIVNDDLSLVVVNTTGHFGLANRISQVITNSGGRVVRLADDQTVLPVCRIKTERRLSNTYTVRKLKTLLGCQVFIGSVENERADVVIQLGEQNWADF
ncbi:MAG: hypothetical protein ABH807_00155 [Candidatus Shapirobacteria bacterium]